MIVVRRIFPAQVGKGGELAALMAQSTQQMVQENETIPNRLENDPL